MNGLENDYIDELHDREVYRSSIKHECWSRIRLQFMTKSDDQRVVFVYCWPSLSSCFLPFIDEERGGGNEPRISTLLVSVRPKDTA